MVLDQYLGSFRGKNVKSSLGITKEYFAYSFLSKNDTAEKNAAFGTFWRIERYNLPPTDLGELKELRNF